MSIRILLSCCLVLAASSVAGQVYRVAEMNTAQIRALARDRTVVLLPGGILEEHGPYLPSFTDGYVNEAITEDLAKAIAARPGWSVLVFPMIPLGTGGANEIGGKFVFPGTYAVRMDTLRAVFMDLADQLGQQGFQWVFVIHDHGAPKHNRALKQAGDYFRDTYGGHMVYLNGLRPESPAAQSAVSLSTSEQAEDGFAVHAGARETSALLAVRPDLVDPAVKAAPPQTARNWADLVRLASSPSWPGYFGSPRLARAELVPKAYFSEWTGLALRILDGLDERTLPSFPDVGSAPENEAIDRAALAEERRAAQRQAAWLARQKPQPDK
jgi:creatinine amidohydrolase/Fe(II)-dependent formamide hydrolase-like protein